MWAVARVSLLPPPGGRSGAARIPPSCKSCGPWPVSRSSLRRVAGRGLPEPVEVAVLDEEVEVHGTDDHAEVVELVEEVDVKGDATTGSRCRVRFPLRRRHAGVA